MAIEKEYACMYCPAIFPTDSLLWDHIGAGDCSNIITAETPSIKQEPIAPAIYREVPSSSDLDSLTSTSASRVVVTLNDANYQNSPKVSLPDSSTTTGDNPALNWKCAVCHIGFFDKATLLKHVKSPDHLSRIPKRVNSPKREDPAPELPAQPTTDPPPMNRDELVRIIRELCREEVPLLLKAELRKIFLPGLDLNGDRKQSPCKDSPQTRPVSSPSSQSMPKLFSVPVRPPPLFPPSMQPNCFVTPMPQPVYTNTQPPHSYGLGQQHMSVLGEAPYLFQPSAVCTPNSRAPETFTCSACDLTMSMSNAHSHLRGKKHLQNLKNP